MKTIEECRSNIQEFANKHKVIFDDDGAIGFGRPCVGLLRGNCYIAYNPIQYPDYDEIEEFYDERLYDIAPNNAYHKGDFIAVLGSGDDAIRELDEWVDKLKGLNAIIEEFETGATGTQAIISGLTGYAVKIPK